MGGSEVLTFYQEPLRNNFNFCYINCNKNYLINCIEKLFQGKSTTMFANQQKFVIHPSNEFCADKNFKNSNETENQIILFLKNTYPKNKMLALVFKPLIKENLIGEDLFFHDFANIHVADFCVFVNNRFGKSDKTDTNMLKLCKYLQKKTLNFLV